MEEHPAYDATIAEAKRLGFEVKTTNGSPHVVVREVVSPEGKVLRLEKELHLQEDMRFLDLEHEMGHIQQLTERFGPDVRPTERWIETPEGKRTEVQDPSQNEVLSRWQDKVTEYQNRLVEFLRLKQRNASTELLREHARGVRDWRAEYRRGTSRPMRKKWASEHFAIPSLEAQYEAAGGKTLE